MVVDAALTSHGLSYVAKSLRNGKQNKRQAYKPLSHKTISSCDPFGFPP